jgi:hypothetical protein
MQGCCSACTMRCYSLYSACQGTHGDLDTVQVSTYTLTCDRLELASCQLGGQTVCVPRNIGCRKQASCYGACAQQHATVWSGHTHFCVAERASLAPPATAAPIASLAALIDCEMRSPVSIVTPAWSWRPARTAAVKREVTTLPTAYADASCCVDTMLLVKHFDLSRDTCSMLHFTQNCVHVVDGAASTDTRICSAVTRDYENGVA